MASTCLQLAAHAHSASCQTPAWHAAPRSTRTLTRERVQYPAQRLPHPHACASDLPANPSECAYEIAPPTCCRCGPSLCVLCSSLPTDTSCIWYTARRWGMGGKLKTGRRGWRRRRQARLPAFSLPPMACRRTTACLAAHRSTQTFTRARAHHPQPHHPHPHTFTSDLPPDPSVCAYKSVPAPCRRRGPSSRAFLV